MKFVKRFFFLSVMSILAACSFENVLGNTDFSVLIDVSKFVKSQDKISKAASESVNNNSIEVVLYQIENNLITNESEIEQIENSTKKVTSKKISFSSSQSQVNIRLDNIPVGIKAVVIVNLTVGGGTPFSGKSDIFSVKFGKNEVVIDVAGFGSSSGSGTPTDPGNGGGSSGNSGIEPPTTGGDNGGEDPTPGDSPEDETQTISSEDLTYDSTNFQLIIKSASGLETACDIINGTLEKDINITKTDGSTQKITESQSGADTYNLKLDANIEIDASLDWQGFGTETSPYTRTFDGNYKTITYSGSVATPLFKYAGGSNCEIKNLVTSGSISSLGTTGGVVANFSGGTIEKCVNNASIKSTSINDGVGGIVGKLDATTIGSTITECVNLERISDGRYTGGIVGYGTTTESASKTVIISKCINIGELTPTSKDSGAFVSGILGCSAFIETISTIENCLNKGKIDSCTFGGNHYYQGISYVATNTTATLIKNSLNVGKVNNMQAANVIAYNATISNSYFDITVNSGSTEDNAKTTEEIVNGEEFKELYGDEWVFSNTHYPYPDIDFTGFNPNIEQSILDELEAEFTTTPSDPGTTTYSQGQEYSASLIIDETSYEKTQMVVACATTTTIPGKDEYWNEYYDGTSDLLKGSFASNDGDVKIEPFAISCYEVTQKLFKAVMNFNPSYYGETPPDDLPEGTTYFYKELRPVEYVTWYDAVAFCNELTKKTLGEEYCYYIIQNQSTNESGNIISATVAINEGKTGYRLPTESEWEFAARGGDPDADEWNYSYPGETTDSFIDYSNQWDPDSKLDNVAIWLNNHEGTTNEVGSKGANTLGLYDMAGNVSEWCYDLIYHEFDELCAVTRGGAYTDGRDYCMVSACWLSPQNSMYFYGFRICRSL